MVSPGAGITIPSVPNLRDLGGWPAGGGKRVRRGLLYRSTALSGLRADDMDAFSALGIRSIYDLRTSSERDSQPDRVPAGTEEVVVDVLGDAAGAAPAQLMQLLSDPAAATPMLDGGKAVALFEHGYREIVRLPSALTAYRRLFTDLADAAHRPALFHCTTGKDRTGWAAAAMLSLLGVSAQDVMQDYLLTNEQLLPALEGMFDRFRAAGADADLLLPVLGVRREYLEVAFDEMHSRFGSLEGYFRDGLRIDEATIQSLRAAFTEKPAD